MHPLRADVPGTIAVLIADSNRMQAQLLAGALRRRSEFRVVTCLLEHASILHAVSSRVPIVALLSLNSASSLAESMAALRGFHLSHPEVVKVVLADICDR